MINIASSGTSCYFTRKSYDSLVCALQSVRIQLYLPCTNSKWSMVEVLPMYSVYVLGAVGEWRLVKVPQGSRGCSVLAVE